MQHQLLWFGESGEVFAKPAVFNAIEYTVAPAMQLAGDAQYLDDGGAGLPPFVLCGRDPVANLGVLQLVVWDEPRSSYITPPGGIFQLPDSDFVGVAWSSQNQVLFLLDATFQWIWMVPYIAGDPLPVLSAWTVLITSGTEPALASASDLIMSLDHDGSDTVLTLSQHRRLTDKDRTVIHITAQGTQTSTVFGSEGRSFVIENLDLVGGATSVRVNGAPDTPVEVLHMLDTGPEVIGSGILDGSGNALVALSAPLAMAENYGTRVTNFPKIFPPFETPVFRDGVAEALDAGSTIRPAPSGLAFTAYVDAPRFKLPLWLDPVDESQVQAPATYDLALHMNLTPDIVTLPDGRKALTPISVGSSTLSVWAKDRAGFGYSPLPIPNDPTLAGVTIYFQWGIVLSPTEAKVSDIVGLQVRDSRWVPPGSEALFGGGEASPTRGSSSPTTLGVSNEREDQRAAAVAWLEACGFRVPSEEYVREFLQRLRRAPK